MERHVWLLIEHVGDGNYGEYTYVQAAYSTQAAAETAQQDASTGEQAPYTLDWEVVCVDLDPTEGVT